MSLPPEGIEGLKTNYPFKNLVKHLKLEDMVTGTAATVPDGSNTDQKLVPVICEECGKEKAVSFCTVCNDSLCPTCNNFHRRSRKTGAHPIVQLGKVVHVDSPVATESEVFTGVRHYAWKCEKHSREEVEIYCKTCDTVTCPRCTINMHKSHDYSFAEDVIDQYHEKIDESARQMQGAEQKFEQAIETVRATKTKLEETERSTAEKICQQCDQIKAELDRQKDALLQTVKQIGEGKKVRLDTHLEELGRVKTKLQVSMKLARDAREHCLPVEFLFLQSQIDDRLRALCSEYTNHSFEPNDDDVISFAVNEDFEKWIREINMIGEVATDPQPDAFTVNDIENAHFIVKKKTTFTVTCQEGTGNRVANEHPEIELEAKTQPESGGDPVQCHVTNNQNGVYVVTVQPQTRGPNRVTLFASINGRVVWKQSYRVIVSPPHRNVTSMEAARSIAKKGTMKTPWGVTVSRDEKVVVSDGESNCLLVFSKDGNFLQTIGKEGKGELEFKSPRGLACTPNNHIVAAERGNHRLQEVTLEGQFVRFIGANESGKAGSENGQFNCPTGVAVNSEAIVFATDSLNHRIQYFKSDGTFLGVIEKRGHGNVLLNDPSSISIYRQPRLQGEGSRELIFVTERQGHQVQCFEKEDGAYVSVKIFGEKGVSKGQMREPVGIQVDQKSGYVFVAEMYNHRISIFSRSGKFISSFGSRGSNPSQFQNPMCIATLGDARLVITDSGNGRVQVFNILES